MEKALLSAEAGVILLGEATQIAPAEEAAQIVLVEEVIQIAPEEEAAQIAPAEETAQIALVEEEIPLEEAGEVILLSIEGGVEITSLVVYRNSLWAVVVGEEMDPQATLVEVTILKPQITEMNQISENIYHTVRMYRLLKPN